MGRRRFRGAAAFSPFYNSIYHHPGCRNLTYFFHSKPCLKSPTHFAALLRLDPRRSVLQLHGQDASIAPSCRFGRHLTAFSLVCIKISRSIV
jgi:hypothetical protein